MRRLLAIVTVLALAGVLTVFATGASDGGDGYKVRAIFQNAFSLVPGEDVKIAGVKVGKIESLDVTEDQQAAVVLSITRAGFDDFRKDAECTIRPQSLIGEKFVECTLTQPHPAGEQPPPPLDVIKDGEGEGERLLPVTNTSRPVDIDLVNNILRLPYRQRLGIIINEFGTALAGRGEDLRSVIRNADPALKATDKVLKLLASQDKVLADLAEQSDTALAPLARERASVAGFVEHAADVATATAERRGAFQEQFRKLPAFLAELRPTMRRLGEFSDEATPVFANLRKVAPDVSRLIKATGPFSASSTVALKSLGEATVPGRKALVAARPIVSDLQTFAATLKPLAKGLADLTTSLRDSGGIERLLDYVFYQVAAINGYDEFGHYLRASLLLNLCSTYATVSDPSCTANFQDTGPTARAASSMTALEALHAPGRDLVSRRTAAVLRGMSPSEAIRLTKGEETIAAPATAGQEDGQASTTGAALGADGQGSGAGPSRTTAEGLSPRTAPDRERPTASEPAARLLEYLLGGGAE